MKNYIKPILIVAICVGPVVGSQAAETKPAKAAAPSADAEKADTKDTKTTEANSASKAEQKTVPAQTLTKLQQRRILLSRQREIQKLRSRRHRVLVITPAFKADQDELNLLRAKMGEVNNRMHNRLLEDKEYGALQAEYREVVRKVRALNKSMSKKNRPVAKIKKAHGNDKNSKPSKKPADPPKDGAKKSVPPPPPAAPKR